MKKLIFSIILSSIFGGVFSQTTMLTGSKTGDITVSGTNIVLIDSITLVSGDFQTYNGADTLNPYIPYADRTDISDVALTKEMTLNAQTGTTYTLVLADAAKLVTLSNASAITMTVPPNSSVAYPTGTQLTIVQLGAGQVTVAAGGGVTIRSADGDLKLRVQYSSATLIKIDTDVWLLIGDIAA